MNFSIKSALSAMIMAWGSHPIIPIFLTGMPDIGVHDSMHFEFKSYLPSGNPDFHVCDGKFREELSKLSSSSTRVKTLDVWTETR
jgi:hypothetical protein